MDHISTNYTAADYCAAMDRNELIVNREYQRSEKVWPDIARSFLIETMLLGFPMPKIYLYSVTDLKNRRTVKEIVGGQQRSMAIKDFFDDKFVLSRKLETEDLAGKKFSELEDDWKKRFITYSISADLFVSATDEEVRETFRRMNSYTVPLNPEEQRHAEFQGAFKWFVQRLAKANQGIFVRAGIFGDKLLIRMQDLKLICEIIHAMLFGIRTTNKKALYNLYAENDEKFNDQQKVRRYFDYAFEAVSNLKSIHGTNLMKPYMTYSLVLAIIHSKYGLKKLTGLGQGKFRGSFNPKIFEEHLLELDESLETPDEEIERSKFKAFILASKERTNVKEQCADAAR